MMELFGAPTMLEELRGSREQAEGGRVGRSLMLCCRLIIDLASRLNIAMVPDRSTANFGKRLDSRSHPNNSKWTPSR
jgi:hypothetical protein